MPVILQENHRHSSLQKLRRNRPREPTNEEGANVANSRMITDKSCEETLSYSHAVSSQSTNEEASDFDDDYDSASDSMPELELASDFDSDSGSGLTTASMPELSSSNPKRRRPRT